MKREDLVMEQTYRFPKDELLKYRHVPAYISGKDYLIVTCSMKGLGHGQTRDEDFALRANHSRDGLEGYLFKESCLRKKKTDRDLYWTVTDEEKGTVSLYSPAKGKYLNMDGEGARLSKNKQLFKIEKDGDFYRFSCEINGETFYLKACGHAESADGMIFSSAREKHYVTFALVERMRGIPAKPAGKPLLTVGTISDPHVDYGLQLFRPYLRKSIPASARAYRNRYDLDVMVTCGDNISDNGSGGYKYGGAMQGKWPREKFLKTQKRMHETVQKSFRDPAKADNILWMTGNHDTQVGDRQPEGQHFNSGDYSAYLPKDLTSVLSAKAEEGVDVGNDEHILCYEKRVNGYPFLVLCTPRYPLKPKAPHPDRFAPAHTMEQADWLEERLSIIEKERGKDAVIFVSSHYPFYEWSFGPEKDGPDNREAFYKMYSLLNRYPNLIFFYGHVHGGDGWINRTETGENSNGNSKVDIRWNAEKNCVNANDDLYRAYFRSDLIVGTGFWHEFAGSLAYFKTTYFANDGKNVNSWLSEVEVPFFQGCVAEVYEDRVVLTMQNLGTKKGLSDHVPNSTYTLKPLVLPLRKD